MLENMTYFCVHRHPCSNSSKPKSSFDGEDHAEVTCKSSPTDEVTASCKLLWDSPPLKVNIYCSC